MKLNRTPVFWGVAAALLLGASCSQALTLGRVRGAALLGQPLDLSVLVQYAFDEELAPTCFQAEVQYGDTPLESSRIGLTLQPGTQPHSQWVRVSSNAQVDEALVRLTLRTLCNPMASRQYTVLADVVSELAAGSAVRTTLLPDASRGLASAKVVSNAATSGQAGASGAVATPSAARKPGAPHSARGVQPAASATAAKLADQSGPVGQVAKAGSTLHAATLDELKRRVDDIAKWQADSSAVEALLKSQAQTQALEADIRGLQLITAKNQQNLQLVAAALESSSAPHYGMAWVYGLGAVLLGCLAALAMVAKRLRSSGFSASPWWSGDAPRHAAEANGLTARASGSGALGARPAMAADLAPAPGSVRESSHGSLPAPIGERYGDTSAATVAMEFTAPAALAQPAPALAERSARPDFAVSTPGNIKSINTKEMLDVRQQAEFFMALGQHDEAVRLLESSIHGSAECNPLVFLDLLKILHTLSRRPDFERYREEFNAQFTGRIPPYANFLSEGNGLDAYEDICHQIVVLWPTEYTIDYIEQCLVRLPEDDPEQGIDLEAFKDLLLLYGVLRRLDQSYDSNLAPFSTSRAEPLSNERASAAMTAPLPIMPAALTARADPPVAVAMDLDLNLDDLEDNALTPSQQDNLIDFDMSEYMAQKRPDTAK
jgi:pilus assembly protein FimV